MKDYVRISNSKVKLFSIDEFKKFAEEEVRRHKSDEPPHPPDPNGWDAPKWPDTENLSEIIADLRAKLDACETTIRDLRGKGKRVVADRDRWEALASQCNREVADLKVRLQQARSSDIKGDQFRQLKNALARMFHPDALRSASNLERLVREELYKEISAEINRIEGKSRSK
jgi:hypothetical protein